jgi:ABC-type amino acid transport system permease subunit
LHTLHNALVRIPITIYVTIIRGTPMLIQITFFYYVLPSLGIEFSPFWAAICAIAINASAYISQIIKSGIIGVGYDQIEAARVLGFNSFQIGRYIVIPQAVRIVFPALVGEYITLLKDSSLASVIGVMELYKEARSIMNESYDVITIFCLVALIYLILTSISELIFRYIERKMSWYVKNP